MIDTAQEIVMDSINAVSKTISIMITTIFLNNGIEVGRSDPWRKAFVPGQINDVKALTGWTDTTPEIIYLNSVWTQQVIDAYNNSQQGA